MLSRTSLNALEGHCLSREWHEPAIGIVHLGIGNFHRAHEALYTEEAMLAEPGDWGICGVTLQGDVTKRDALMAQDGLYSVVERGPDGVRVTVVRALREVLAMPFDRARLVELFADERVRIVSLTVTEKATVAIREPAMPTLRTRASRTISRIRTSRPPCRAYSAPRCERDATRTPRPSPCFPATTSRTTTMHCVRRCVRSHAGWTRRSRRIETRVAFPSTMVDRIVPATTDADREAAQAALGVGDEVPVPCEPFRQWVIEDRFPAGRPAWETAGAQLVDDVAPFEIAKLRMLNATHSTLAYLSMLAGFDTISDAVGHPPLKSLIHAMMTREIAPTLAVPASFDLAAYRDALLDRYANPALKHRCSQIAMDGSQKMPPRILSTIQVRLDAGQPFERLALAVAAWFTFLRGRADDGTRYAISDPLAERLTKAAEDATTPAGLVDALVGASDVFPASLARNPVLREALLRAATRLANGALTAIDEYVRLD